MKLFLFSLLLGTLAARRLNNEEEEAYIAIVPYEYKIEVDYGEVLLNERDIGQALENFTFTTLNDLSGDNSPVQILEIISADVENCVSMNDTCSIYESSVSLAVDPTFDETAIHRATLEEIQSFFDGFNYDNPGIYVSFMGPFVVHTDIIIRLSNVNRIMNAEEIALFESTLVDVLDPLADGVSLTSSKVFLQQLTSSREGRLLQSGDSDRSSNDIFIRANGQCRECTSTDFALFVNDAVGSSSGDLEKELLRRNKGINGGSIGSNTATDEDDDYFEDASVSVISQAQRGSSIARNSTSDTFIPPSTISFPYWILIILGAGVFVISSGFCYVGYLTRIARLNSIAKLRNRCIERQELAREDLRERAPMA